MDRGSGISNLERVRFRALVMAGDRQDRIDAESLVADWVQSAERLYHEREFERSRDVARFACKRSAR